MAITYDVHEGRPSWHQSRAGHSCAAVTAGFTTREAAQEYIDRLLSLHPGMVAYIREVKGRSHD